MSTLLRPEELGVDVTTIDAFLAMTVEERLRRNEEASRTVRALQAAWEKAAGSEITGVNAGDPRPR